MFYESVKALWEAGKVRIGLPTVSTDQRVYVEADGLIGLKAAFLSQAERQMLAELAKNDAQLIKGLSKPVSSWTPEQRDAVRRLVRSVGLQGEDSPQRALLEWEGEQLLKPHLPNEPVATARPRPDSQ